MHEIASGSTDQATLHSLVQVTNIADILPADVPSDELFRFHRIHYQQLFPKAVEGLIDHLMSVERLIWHSCVFGLSFNSTKVQLATSIAKMLGD